MNKTLVIIPTYNRAHLISQSLESVLQQSFKDSEIIVVDDGSSDATFMRACEFSSEEGRVKAIRFSRNFANGVNFSIEHRRINNTGAYDNQKATNSDVAVGFWFHNKHNTYDGFFSYVTNSVQQQDNGGIMHGEDTVFTDAFRLDVNLQNSNTRYANSEYAYTQYFYLNNNHGVFQLFAFFYHYFFI